MRLRRRAEYLGLQKRGRRVHGEHFLMLFIPEENRRMGITVSSRVGGSVVRNRVRRWVREYLRRHKGDWPGGDAVVIAKPSAAGAVHAEVDRDLERLLRKARTR